MILAEGYWLGDEYIPEMVGRPVGEPGACSASTRAQDRRARVRRSQARRPRAGRGREARLRARLPQWHAGRTPPQPHRQRLLVLAAPPLFTEVLGMRILRSWPSGLRSSRKLS